MLTRRWIYGVLLGFAGLSCGSPTPAWSPPDPRLQPLTMGSQWTYRVTDTTVNPPVETMKTNTITGTDVLNGAPVIVWETTTTAGTRTVELLAAVGNAIARFRDSNYAGATYTGRVEYLPYRLRVPIVLGTAGAQLTESFTEDSYDAAGARVASTAKSYDWTLEDPDAVVTVPAGTFHTLQLRRVNRSTGTVRRYYYAPDVGKVREDGPQNEVLVSYSVL